MRAADMGDVGDGTMPFQFQLALSRFAASVQVVEVLFRLCDQTVQAQLTAITKWGQAPNSSERLKQVRHPVLIANGDADVMVPTQNSIALADTLPNAKLSIFPDAGHGGIFEYADAFVDQTLRFLAA